MEIFLQTFGGVTAMFIGIVAVTLFFWAVSAISARGQAKRRTKRSVLAKTVFTLYLVDKTVLHDVRVGAFDLDPGAGIMPFSFRQFVRVERSDGTHLYLRNELIEKMEVATSIP